MDLRIEWARSATKHRIARARSRYVIDHCVLRFRQEPGEAAPGRSDPRIVMLGDDANGIALEVMAVETNEKTLLVIHAMPLRDRYRAQYKEAKRWCR